MEGYIYIPYIEYDLERSVGKNIRFINRTPDWPEGQKQRRKNVRELWSTRQLLWRPVPSGDPHGSVRGPVLFNMFNDLDEGRVRTIIKFTDDTKLGGVADTPEGSAAIQQDHDRLERNLCREINQKSTRPNVVLCLGKNNPVYQHWLGDDPLERSSGKKDLGVWCTTG